MKILSFIVGLLVCSCAVTFSSEEENSANLLNDYREICNSEDPSLRQLEIFLKKAHEHYLKLSKEDQFVVIKIFSENTVMPFADGELGVYFSPFFHDSKWIYGELKQRMVKEIGLDKASNERLSRTRFLALKEFWGVKLTDKESVYVREEIYHLTFPKLLNVR